MRTQTEKLATVAVMCVLALCTATASGADIEGLTPELLEEAGHVLRRADADNNRLVTAQEIVAGKQDARERYGKLGELIYDRCVKAADANADGAITADEWSALQRAVAHTESMHQETVFIEADDGTRLATEIFRPTGPGPFPVILTRTPYGRRPADPPPRGILRAGYAVVRQDMRGRFDSEGENLPFVGCGWAKYRDGAATVKWLLAQPWCNGRVGTLGGSACGITQNLLAGAAPQGLVCQYINVAAASLYHHAAYVGGALRWSQVDRWLRGNEFSDEALKLYREHHSYDEFWHDFDSTTRHAAMTVPAVHVGGWFDTFSLGTITSFVGRQHDGGEGARGKQVLVMGPWAHGGYRNGGKVGELVFANSRQPHDTSSRRWFDHYLRQVDNGLDELPPVHYFVMGDVDAPNAPGNEWRSAGDWPVPCEMTPFYLAADGTLSEKEGGDAATAPLLRQYTFDPRNPCPTRGGCNLTIPAGPMDQRRVEARDDVLVYTGRALTEPVEITGHIRAVIFLESDAVDTDLSVRFCDVYPDGRSMLMAEGMQRVRYRDGPDREVLLTPGTVTRVTVDLWPTSIIINRGHRMRIDVTSSNYPRFDINPGTGKPWREGAPSVPQTNRVHSSAAHSSHVLMPLVK
jgi:predicted acyl esterase